MMLFIDATPAKNKTRRVECYGETGNFLGDICFQPSRNVYGFFSEGGHGFDCKDLRAIIDHITNVLNPERWDRIEKEREENGQ